MGILAGYKAAWGEDWGYDRSDRHYYGDIADVMPSSHEGADNRDEFPDPPDDLSGFLGCTVFWLLLIVSTVLWWTGR